MSNNDINNFLSGFGGCELTLDKLLGLDSEFMIDSMDELLQQQPEQHTEHHMLQPEQTPLHELDNLEFMLHLPTDLIDELLFEPAQTLLTSLHELDNLEFMPDLSACLLQEQLFEPAQSEQQEQIYIVLEGDEEKKINPFFKKLKKKELTCTNTSQNSYQNRRL